MSDSKEKNLTRFLLTFFLSWIGSIIINNTDLKPNGYKSRTLAYFFLSVITGGIYGLVASIANLSFDPAKPSNIGYAKEEGYVHTSLTNSAQSTISASTASAMPPPTMTLKLQIQKITVLCMAIFSLVMLFFPIAEIREFLPLHRNIPTGFSFITGSDRAYYGWRIPARIFCFLILIASIVMIVLTLKNFKKVRSNDQIAAYISIACSVLYMVIGIFYQVSISDDYNITPTPFYAGLIVEVLLLLAYFLIGKLNFAQNVQQPVSMPTAPQEDALSIDDKVNSIKHFAELKENGIITEEEFDKMKKKFLDM